MGVVVSCVFSCLCASVSIFVFVGLFAVSCDVYSTVFFWYKLIYNLYLCVWSKSPFSFSPLPIPPPRSSHTHGDVAHHRAEEGPDKRTL